MLLLRVRRSLAERAEFLDPPTARSNFANACVGTEPCAGGLGLFWAGPVLPDKDSWRVVILAVRERVQACLFHVLVVEGRFSQLGLSLSHCRVCRYLCLTSYLAA